MSQARTARRRRKQLAMNNAHLSGLRVPRYSKPGGWQTMNSGRLKEKK